MYFNALNQINGDVARSWVSPVPAICWRYKLRRSKLRNFGAVKSPEALSRKC